MIAFDFETHLISKSEPYPKPICVSSFNGWNKVLLTGDEIEPHLAQILKGDSVAHNATFEAGVIYRWYPNLREALKRSLADGRFYCTQVMQGMLNCRLQYPQKKLSLGALVKNYFEEDISEAKTDPNAWRLRYSELEHTPKDQWPEDAKNYAIMDSVWCYKLYQELKTHNIPIQRATEASFYLNQIGKTGIKINRDRVKQLEAELYQILDPKFKYLVDNSFGTFIGTKKRPKKNLKQFIEYITQNVEQIYYTPKGNVRTDFEALGLYYAETGLEPFKVMEEINTYDKVLTAFVSRLKETDIIYTDYSTTKETGRTSSSSSKLYPSVNIQQMPRKVPDVTWDVRNCFVPREGFKMVSIDYSGLELASTASQLKKVFGRSEMLDLLNSGDTPVDLHSMLAAKIMTLKGQNTTYETFLRLKKTEPYASMRQLCKAINLGFPGGIGYDVMRKQLLQGGTKTHFEILYKAGTKEEVFDVYWKWKDRDSNLRMAQLKKDEFALVYDELVGFKKDMFKIYPDLERFLKDYHKHALTGETKRMLGDFDEWVDEPMYSYQKGDFKRDWCTYPAYCNGFLMQTPSAIGATKTAIALGRMFIDSEDLHLLAFIHDEFLFEVKNDLLIPKVAEVMIDNMKLALPGVRIAVEANSMEYWTKEGDDAIVYWKDSDSSILRSK